MSHNLKLDPRYLEPDELAYEKDIRSHYTPPKHVMYMSEMGVVAHWMNEEEIDPETLPHKIPTDDIGKEIEKCSEKIKELHELVLGKFVTTGSFIGASLEEAAKIGSRLVHYDYRIRRIDISGCTEDQQSLHADAQNKGAVARSVVAGAIAVLSPPPANEIPTTSNALAHTVNDTHGTHNQQQDNQSGPILPVPTGPQQSVSTQQPNGPGLNSTGIEPIRTEFPQFDLTNPEQSPYNAAADVQKRMETEAARRATEFELCLGRIADLHSDIMNEYCLPISPRRPSEAQGFMNRLQDLERVLRNLFVLASDSVTKREIEEAMTKLLRDAYVLQTNIMVHAQQTQKPIPTALPPTIWDAPAGNPPQNLSLYTHTGTRPNTQVGQAHSTMHPVHPNQVSVPLFNRAVDGLTFNVSQPFTVHDTPLASGVRDVIQDTRQGPHVTFGTNPVTYIPPNTTGGTQTNGTSAVQSMSGQPNGLQSRSQMPTSQAQQQSGSSWWPQPTQQQVNQQMREAVNNNSHQLQQPQSVVPGLPSIGDILSNNLSSGSSGSRNRAGNRTYHPAISPNQYPEYAAPEPSNESRLAAEAQIGQLPGMNACQGQQYLARVLGHRRYVGCVTDNTKTISLDEFMGHARAYQRSTGNPDAVVLSQLTTFLSEGAFIWWNAHGSEVTSLDDLESRLKSRFERKATDYMSVFGEFCSRKQGENEDLLDYVDHMILAANKCTTPPLTVPQIVTRIVDNSNEKYRKTLAAKQYKTVTELTVFAEYIVCGEKPKQERSTESSNAKRNWQKPWHKSAIVSDAEVDAVQPEELPNECDSEDSGDKAAAIEMIAKEIAKLSMSYVKGNGKAAAQHIQANGYRNDQHNRMNQQNRSNDGCWGCGAPGVFKQNCPKCSPNPKNELKHPQ